MTPSTQTKLLRLQLLAGGDTPPAGPCLATVTFGSGPPPAWSPLAIQVPLDPLGEDWTEVWHADQAPTTGESHGFHLAETEFLTVGSVQLEGRSLERQTNDLYTQLLTLCEERGRRLCRVWNTIPDCLGGPAKFLRYMEFCKGRAEAFEAHFGASFARHLCAFSAVGSFAGPQTLHFLATTGGGLPVENSRQTSAYRYPRRYGPRSPSFARGLRLPDEHGQQLLVSGTASIVGHESRHPGDVIGQTRETLRNLRAVLSASDTFTLLKVYLRHPRDQTVVARMLAADLPGAYRTVWLHADICRPELLVEIEGVARPR